jgi:1-phosphofructokinase family hexose kinase
LVLTVTLNPIIEQRLHFNKIEIGVANRSSDLSYYAGGKGINVSRQLKTIGVQNIALTFLGGDNGKRLRAALTQEGINFTAVSTKSETRFGSVIIEDEAEKVTHYFGPNSSISAKEVEEFKIKLEKMMLNCEFVVFSGSSPSPECDDIFQFGLEVAEKYDKITILDTYGKALSLALSNQPTVLHINKKEAEEYFRKPLNNEEDIIDALQRFKELGIKISIITDGGKPFYVNNFGYIYKVISPSVKIIDETGSGDAFTAGFVFGLFRDEILLDSLRFATGFGAANAGSIKVCEVALESAETLFSRVIVEPVGKKMNLMNDMA